ncbi:putative RNA-directed DNA polymerase [Tanacetum coccineum]
MSVPRDVYYFAAQIVTATSSVLTVNDGPRRRQVNVVNGGHNAVTTVQRRGQRRSNVVDHRQPPLDPPLEPHRRTTVQCGSTLSRFSSMKGLDAMLENGPWFIRNNPLILKKWNPDVNLLKEDVGNVPVWVKLHGVPVTAFREDGLSRSRYARALIEVRANVKLKDNIVVAMPKLVGEGFYMCNVRVEYEWKPPRCACCKVFGHVQDECPKNIDSDVVKNMKKPNQTPRGVPVTPKVGFKPAKQVYRQVSNSNPFNVLNSVENDVDLGTNGGTSNLASQKVNSSGSSFWNVKSNSTSTTLIIENINKMERLIIDGKVILVDYEGK